MVTGKDGHVLCASVVALVVGGRHNLILLLGHKIGVTKAIAATELYWDGSRRDASA